MGDSKAQPRAFAYFTHATLDFATSSKHDPELEPARYLATVCEGVSRHLLRRERPRRAQAPTKFADRL